ncbi:hypothetical protein J1614_006811 [Plenodomus biglobosus]|nr:hypothetical protein J1614_006811 [Plenodomus biglobosus]
MTEPLLSTETLYGSQNDSAQSKARYQSLGEHTSTHGFKRDYTNTPPPGALHTTLGQWMLQGQSCGSPLSTMSSLSPSESIATPPPYPDQLPLAGYYLDERQHQPCQDSAVGCASYGSVAKVHWESQCATTNNWNEHSMAPGWPNDIYPGLPLPATEPFVSSIPVIAPPAFSLPSTSTSHSTTNHLFATAPRFQSNEADSDTSDSESEASNTDIHEPGRTPNSHTTPHFTITKWDLSSTPPYTRQQSHPFPCPLTGHLDTRGKLCTANFARPEHCRRHVKTVHGAAREYHCKVPRCERAFSRGDNLRDHYWTHLQRGGRVGKNDKMTLEELREVLGRGERRLVRRLRVKMERLRERQGRGVVRARL